MSDINAKNVGSVINNPNAPVNITNIFNDGNKHSSSSNIAENIDHDVQLLYDSLKGFYEQPSFFQKVKGFFFREKVTPKYRKGRYQERFDSKLDGRFEITLEVNKEPFTVNYQTNKNIDEAFKAINEAFNQKGRLLIVGSPGSGKTVLLLKLAIELLGDKCKTDQKLPIIFNLASWSEDYASFEDWLIDVLNSGNGLSKDFARTLLQEKRIIFLLDGLDELARNEDKTIAHQKRAKCLASLNDYLREGRKAVICCRQEEFLKMSSETNQLAPVESTVKVNDLEKPEIILALQHAQNHNESRASATNLLQIIDPNEVFLDVLSTPFYFTTALEVFDKQLLNEKDFPTDKEAIKKYLLDRFIENKLNHTKALTAFEGDKAKIKHWLSWLAKLLEKKQLVNFELADLQPNLLFNKQKYGFIYTYISGIVVSIALGVALNLFGLFHSIILQDFVYFILVLVQMIVMIIVMFIISLFSGILFGLIGMVYYSIRPDSIKTDDNYWFDLKKILYFNNWGKAFSAVAFGMITCNILIIPIAILYGLFSIIQVTIPYTQLNAPYKRLKGGTTTKIIFVSLIYLVFILLSLSLLLFSRISDSQIILIFANIFVLIFFTAYPIIFLMILLFRHFVLRLCIYYEKSIPLKYATFLDLAAEARILEKDGGHWRFRHQTLQEHFAKIDIKS